MSVKPLQNRSLSVGLPRGSAYYQALYVKQGKSGLFRDSMGCAMLQRDVLASQRELARRLSSAVIVENTSAEEKK